MGMLLLMGGGSPLILVQPQDASKAVNETAAFSVTARDARSYQWVISIDGGQTFEQLPEATASSYTTGTLSEFDNGLQFRVLVGNEFGTTHSRAATLTVTGGGGLPE